jgi:hypothetical protein
MNIAVESSVYERLLRAKGPSESFSETIARLLDRTFPLTCADAVADARSLWRNADDQDVDACRMEQIIRQNRAEADWSIEKPA